MARTIRDELELTGEFRSLEEQVLLNLQRTAQDLSDAVNQLLRSHGLTASQYNVLRILRGAGRTGLPCRSISERMVTRDSDLTRILDGLEREELVTRERSSADRRVVQARLASAGRRLLGRIDAPLDSLHRRQLGHLGKPRLRELSMLLDRARSSGSK